jgi:hypothetical protein
MAARKRTWTPQKVRDRIQTGLLAKRLMLHAFGKLEMTLTQLKATEILLRKTLPDLSATEISGELTRRDITDKPLTAEEWAAEHCVETPSGSTESTH